MDGTKNTKCCAEWLKDFNEKILTPLLRKKHAEVLAKPKSASNNDIYNQINDSFIKLTGGVINIAVKAILLNISPSTATIKAGDVSMFEN